MFTLCVQLFQTAQISAFAQETSTVIKSESESIEEISESEEKITDDIPSDTEAETDIESTEETDMEETEEEFTEESVDDEMSEEEIESENESENAIMLLAEGAESTPWEIIQENGGPKTPYAFGPGITYGEYDSMELLKQWLQDLHKTTTVPIEWNSNGMLDSMPLDHSAQLILLSVTDPQVYQNTEFKTGSVTGDIPLTDKAGESTLTFQGLGSDVYPFQGKFQNSSFTVNRTLFNSLKYTTDSFENKILTIDWKGERNTGAIVASKIITINSEQLTVNLTRTEKKYSFRGAAFNEISGDLELTISFDQNDDKNDFFENIISVDQNNVGMVANTVTDGTLILKVSSFPSDIQIGIDESTDDLKSNAGLLVGCLNNASLTLNFTEGSESPKAIIQSAKGAAGGIVGRINTDAVSTIALNGNVDLSNVTILGKYSGSIAGYAKDVAFEFGDNDGNTFTLPESLGVKANNIAGSGDVSSCYTGGIFGWYSRSKEGAYDTYDGTGFSYPDCINLHADTSNGETGALFGHLELNSSCNYSVTGTDQLPLSLQCKIQVADTASLKASGGLVGRLVGQSAANRLDVAYTDVSVYGESSNKINYLGGLVGMIEKTSIDVNQVKIIAPQPVVTTFFGGLVGNLGEACVLKTRGTIEIATTDAATPVAITKGGGLVGQANVGSVVRLSGVTNLSNVAYTPGSSIGQLVGKQEKALVFATGSGADVNWEYYRSNKTARVDDIGNYGQVIRLGDKLSDGLITIDDTDNTVSFSAHGSYGIINTADDFALHSIAFSTEDQFNLYGGSSSGINTANVTLTKDIDLTGTGIQGLTRDALGSWVFNGKDNGQSGITFDGGNYTLTINTGEIYGLREGNPASGEGSGQCYRHGSYGLLGAANSAVVKNLTIQGTMNIGADVETNAGFIFGKITGGNADDTIENKVEKVIVETESTINVDGTSYANVGGFIGYADGEKTEISVNNSTMSGVISNTGTSDQVVLGGVMGKDYYDKSISIDFDTVTVSGKIESNTTANAHLGGLIAEIIPKDGKPTGTARMSLKNIIISSEINNNANTTSGGLLGYYWNNVEVIFDGKGEEYSITTTGNASLTTNGASTGGLCFAATGKWDMQGNAVNMNNATISNGTGALGLLVCHGERQGSVPGSYSNTNATALYLVMDTNWSTAYKNEQVSISGTPSVFDEIVAYTAKQSGNQYDIMLNDAGIISLHTVEEEVKMSASGEGNTYKNRTLYGQTKETNPNSRYYYNLDRMSNPAPKGEVDTSAEFLIWSVRKYCASNICSYLPDITSNTISGTLNMDGYSYYPVSIVNTGVMVNNATITFWNKEIEEKETGNKSTLASETNNRTQHFAMHSGIFYDYYTDKDAAETAVLTVNNLTLLGTVGMVADGSGALLCGKIYGYNGTNQAKLELDGLKVDSTDNQTHLAVSNFNNNEYAPLLIHRVNSFAMLNIAGVTAKETEEGGATSLIGNVGDPEDPNTRGINISFSKMKLPDKTGRFTKATMLNRLYYTNQNNSAVYNFTKEEDWEDSTHKYQVTYGKEIGGTVEYADSASNPHQYWYAQSKDYVSHTGQNFTNGGTRDEFDSYLPYVAVPYDGNGYHELQVNSSLTDILVGCGTYGDPYQISDAKELQSIATFLSTGSASRNWTLNIPNPNADGSSQFCPGNESSSTHMTYVYNGSQWVANGDETKILENATVYTYLQNAYYQITQSMKVNNFVGLGTRANPFRGVVVGETGNETITLTGTLPQGFIVCSYGSVVKDLNLSIEGSTTVLFRKIQDNSGYTSESYYGGVIGCILGGDNIIDGVDVTYTNTDQIQLGDSNSYLIPVSGYIGVISGGGVIFRGENTLKGMPNSKVGDNNYFYANRYIGRVLQGFAVKEGDGKKLDNSEKNYQICQLDSKKYEVISVEGSNITIKDAQALLIFSSVTNSGGAGGGTLLPYYTNARTYWNDTKFSTNDDGTIAGGKVRNAAYDKVGTVTDAEDSEYKQSLQDDFASISSTNTSYLDTKYAGKQLFNICGDTAYNIRLNGDAYDMTVYGNGYRSISPRYLANAVCDNATNTGVTTNYKRLNPLVSSVSGIESGSQIQTDITVKEYVDDDHHAIAVGGVFNTLRFSTNATMKNITIGGSETSKGNIFHEYYEWSGTKLDDATHKNWNGNVGFTNLNYQQGRGLIAIGGFAGNTTEETDNTYKITFNDINTQCLNIKGPFDAGGVIGHTGLRVTSTQADKDSTSKNYHIGYLIGQNSPMIIPSFQNCRYQNLDIRGGMMVGGYIGLATKDQYAPPQGKSSYNGEIIITFQDDSNAQLGKDSHIICQRPKTDSGIDAAKGWNSNNADVTQRCLPASGGLIGCSGLKVSINNDKRATIENVEVRSTRSAGGIIAWPFSNVTIKNVSIIGNSNTPNQIGDLPIWKENTATTNEPSTICEFSGGIVGYFESNGLLSVTDCKVENLQIVASLRNSYPCYAGGIVGNINTDGNHIIANCEVSNIILANVKYNNSSKVFYGGGLVGGLQKGNLYGANILIDSMQEKGAQGDVKIGNLLSFYETSTLRTVYLAGVSVQNTRGLTSVLQNDFGGTKTANCYVAFADYNGSAKDNKKSGNIVPSSKEPYVTTSPKGASIPVGAANSEGEKPQLYLYGDGADPNIVKSISEQNKSSKVDKYYYSQTQYCTFEARYSSDFYSEMGLTEETAGGIPNFPVLQVAVSDKTTVSKQIVDYLDLITNKGYSTARNKDVGASGHISYFIDLYKWNENGKYFEKNPDGVNKAFSGSGGSFETSFIDYDSGKNQFELLTVKFTEETYTYEIRIPIVVRRMLEVDFTATLKDSPSFKTSDYEFYKDDGFKPNITVDYGISVSALLTYTYNSAIGVAQDYDWQFHLDNGGFMGDPGQTIQFNNNISALKSLPKGTQLTLLDCENNNKAYKYTVEEQSTDKGTSIKLSDFKDSDGIVYSSRWLSEIMGVEAEQNAEGKWVQLSNEEGATARIKLEDGYQYFRPKTAEDKDTALLHNLIAKENRPEEQFYLVIYIPEDSVNGIPEGTGTDGKNINGYIFTSFPGLENKIACNINAVRVKQDRTIVTDPHSSSESTYNFLSGYTQSLSDQSSDKELRPETDPEAYILLDQPESDGNYLLHMDLVDEITVVKGQKDTADTPLYFKENVSLPNYAKAENDTVSLVTANGFPTGCYGTVEFYVYLDNNGNKTYYKSIDDKWVSASGKEKALSYDWNSNGGNMELYLGTENNPGKAVSLAAIRELAKSRNEKFYVETKIDIHMSVPAAEQVIAGAIAKGNAYTKLSYTTYLASDENSFSNTNYVESKQGEVRYYQSRSGNSTLTHSANDPTQLGINCSDLASANGVIFTTGVYDLTTVSNAEKLIKDADKVTYTLTLWQRQNDGSYDQIERNLDKYIRSVRMDDQTVSYTDGYQWTDTKSNTGFASMDPENSKRFLLPIRVEVNTDVETNDVTFANYQLRLTATLYKDNEVLDQPINNEIQVGGKTEYIRYDYVTYTITRILTDGYWGDTNSETP